MSENSSHIPKNCRLCGAAKENQTIRAENVFGSRKNHKFWHCKNCDVIYIFPIPSVAEQQFFYKKEFENLNQLSVDTTL